ncbi:hypothetical protein J4468_00210 [Candidatus Woesearchaeota archaeon]|nr:hypothetical protein [Candidatus Woesearchaeota archaeon]
MKKLFIAILKDLKKKFYLIPIDIIYIFLNALTIIFTLRKVTQHMNNLYNLTPQIQSLQEALSIDSSSIQPVVDALNHELNLIYFYFILCAIIIFVLFVIFQSIQFSLSYNSIKEFKRTYLDYFKRVLFISGFFGLFLLPVGYYLFNSITWVINSLDIYSILLFLFIMIIKVIVEYLAVYTMIFSLKHPFKQAINTVILLLKDLKLFCGYLFFKLLLILVFALDLVLAWFLIDNYAISAIILIILLGSVISFSRLFLMHLAFDKKI